MEHTIHRMPMGFGTMFCGHELLSDAIPGKRDMAWLVSRRNWACQNAGPFSAARSAG